MRAVRWLVALVPGLLLAGPPLAFEPHDGHYLARTRHSLVRFTPTAVIFENGRLEFLGASPRARLEAVDPLPATVNNLTGLHPTHLPTYARLFYRDLYPGIDLVFYGTPDRLQYDFLVSPGADRNQIRLHTTPGFQLATAPTVGFSTYLGGGSHDLSRAIATTPRATSTSPAAPTPPTSPPWTLSSLTLGPSPKSS